MVFCALELHVHGMMGTQQQRKTLKDLKAFKDVDISRIMTGPLAANYPEAGSCIAMPRNFGRWMMFGDNQAHTDRATPTDINKNTMVGTHFRVKLPQGGHAVFRVVRPLAGGAMNGGVFLVQATSGEGAILKFPERAKLRDYTDVRCKTFDKECATLGKLTDDANISERAGGKVYVPRLLATEVQFGEYAFQASVVELARGDSLDKLICGAPEQCRLDEQQLANLKHDLQGMLSWFADNHWIVDDWKWDHIFYDPAQRALTRIDFGNMCSKQLQVASGELLRQMKFEISSNCEELQEHTDDSPIAKVVDLLSVRGTSSESGTSDDDTMGVPEVVAPARATERRTEATCAPIFGAREELGQHALPAKQLKRWTGADAWGNTFDATVAAAQPAVQPAPRPQVSAPPPASDPSDVDAMVAIVRSFIQMHDRRPTAGELREHAQEYFQRTLTNAMAFHAMASLQKMRV